jgi:hypothetical protein
VRSAQGGLEPAQMELGSSELAEAESDSLELDSPRLHWQEAVAEAAQAMLPALPAEQKPAMSPRTFRRSDSPLDFHFRNVRSATCLLESTFRNQPATNRLRHPPPWMQRFIAA